MKSIFLLICILIFIKCIQYKDEQEAFKLYQDFIKKYNKQYSSIQDFEYRYSIFKENLNRKLYSNGRWEEGITKFFDISVEEFAKTHRNYRSNKAFYDSLPIAPIKSTNKPPEEYTWLDKGVVPKIKDQGNCGSCWAFSICGNLQPRHAIEHKENATCSEQMLVDCDEEEWGCEGGNENRAVQWLAKKKGIATEEAYPYVGKDQECHMDPSTFKIKVRALYQMPGESEYQMKGFLIDEGPYMVAMNAKPLQFYSGGIIDVEESECNVERRDHALVLVGYGTDKEKNIPYWIVRNSWGEDWGEHGYFRIVRDKGACGINLECAVAYIY